MSNPRISQKIVLVVITNPGISYIVVLRVSLCHTINHNDPIVIFIILAIYDPTDPTMIFKTISPKKTHPMTAGPSDHIHLWPLSTRSRHGGGAVVEAQNRWLVQMPRAVAPEVVEMDLGSQRWKIWDFKRGSKRIHEDVPLQDGIYH